MYLTTFNAIKSRVDYLNKKKPLTADESKFLDIFQDFQFEKLALNDDFIQLRENRNDLGHALNFSYAQALEQLDDGPIKMKSIELAEQYLKRNELR
ncbi:hypothetical protein MIR68_008938 [Amoeboaphelidium protococcarum]|nr:hypothetical protein MIR68_008938 [Amoeboaphelidium protococcarum]